MTDQKYDVSCVLALNMCEEERTILDDAHFQGLDVSDCYNELRQAAFDYFWDGETPEEEFKEECWVLSNKDYETYLDCWDRHPLHMAAGRGLVDELDELIKSGTDLDDMDDRCKTAIDVAANEEVRGAMQSVLQVRILQSMTASSIGGWSPDPRHADAQFDQRVSEAMSQGQGLEPQRQQAGARMRL